MEINRKIGLGLVAGLLTAFTACSSGENKQAGSGHEGHAHEEAANEAGNPQFKDEKTKEVYQHYVHLKTALVNTDAKEAQAGAAALQTAMTNAGNTEGADIAGKIASASDIKQQRDQFDELTDVVENLVKSAGLSGGKIFKQYCPMAKEGEGAYWLASETEIRNPYYGDEMLECGEVKEEIK
ncbi:DUF3347 domain-containing protein [Pedobacter sp. SYSU D00535]|uniref:DUF3347 domain-containing protein n=1 Tax=Pedobacter sp. SYSU D00535 TaxID=2810308 RepID=UPI001A95E5B8|nr:DUF3347 domain-containing protein [Pedobacter sp. SYSU D00535]